MRWWEPAFLAAVRRGASTEMACQLAGMSRSGVYEAIAKDEDLARRWNEAKEAYESERAERKLQEVNRKLPDSTGQS